MVMSGLAAQRDGVWSLDELVEVANSLLPDYLPKDASGRFVDEVNARLVRHHATQGLLPEALKEGREARYVYPHLVHLLLVRKLLAEGFGTAAIRQVIEGRAPADLEGLLAGSVRIELTPRPLAPLSAERQAFLQRVRAKAGLAPDPGGPGGERAPARPSPPPPPPHDAPREPSPAFDVDSLFDETTWSRITLLDGLDLFVRDDFVLPSNRLGDEQLTQLLKVVLLQLEQRRKRRA